MNEHFTKIMTDIRAAYIRRLEKMLRAEMMEAQKLLDAAWIDAVEEVLNNERSEE